MRVIIAMAAVAALAAGQVYGQTASSVALSSYAAEPRVASSVDVGVRLGEPVEASAGRLDARRRLAVYDVDGRRVPSAVMVPVAKPGALIPPTATKVLGAALVVRDVTGWRVAAVRFDFLAPKEDTFKALAAAESLRDEGVRFRVPDASGWATITASDGSQEAADLATSVADFFARLHARRGGAR